jgi:hypothetical protein
LKHFLKILVIFLGGVGKEHTSTGQL